MTPKTPLPETGFLRLKQIIGDPKANPPIPAIIPISKSNLWLKVKQGSFPAPLHLGRCSVWSVVAIREYVDKLGQKGGDHV